MDEQYIRKGFDFALSHVMGECAEVVAIAVKLQQWGPHSIDPTLCFEDKLYGETNLQGVLRELSDLDAAACRLYREIAGNSKLLHSLPLHQRRRIVAWAEEDARQWPAE